MSAQDSAVALEVERAAFEACLKSMPEWEPEFEVHRAWVEQFAWFAWQARASQSDGTSGEEPMELALCESQRLVLRIGRTYRFVPVAGCKTCEAMAAQANDAYGYEHSAPNQGENHVG